jgi:hypothetical protein
VVAAGALLAAAASAQTWVQRTTPVAPAARDGHRMAYDASRQRTVLQGGSLAYSPSGWGGLAIDTWEWDGRRWLQRAAVTFPMPRTYAALVFDRARGTSVLFGGQLNPLWDDTWEWDGANWTQASPAVSPSARVGHSMAYDTARGRVVLFGGTDTNNPYFTDTWEWDGSSWSRRATAGPAGRGEHSMAYDSARARVVMFGGYANGTLYADTWEWDGVSWTQRTPAQSTFARSGHRLAYDSVRSRVVLFGGRGVRNGPTLTETWEWDGTSWSQLQVAASPSTRDGFDMVYDEARGRAVLFGGYTSLFGARLGDTWELVATTATATPFGTGCGSPALTVAPAANSRPLLGATQVTDVTNVPARGALMALGLSRAAIGPVALPLALDPFGLPGCTLYQDNLVPGVPCTPTAAGAAQHRIAIPNDLDLAGAHVYLQAWAPAPGANPAGVVFSNAVDLLLGNL